MISNPRPLGLTFSVTQKNSPGRIKPGIIHAYLAVRDMPSTRIDLLIEGDSVYQLFHDRTHEIEFDSNWNWKALISFQVHISPGGQKLHYAVARPFKPYPPEPFFSQATEENLKGIHHAHLG